MRRRPLGGPGSVGLAPVVVVVTAAAAARCTVRTTTACIRGSAVPDTTPRIRRIARAWRRGSVRPAAAHLSRLGAPASDGRRRMYSYRSNIPVVRLFVRSVERTTARWRLSNRINIAVGSAQGGCACGTMVRAPAADDRRPAACRCCPPSIRRERCSGVTVQRQSVADYGPRPLSSSRRRSVCAACDELSRARPGCRQTAAAAAPAPAAAMGHCRCRITESR